MVRRRVALAMGMALSLGGAGAAHAASPPSHRLLSLHPTSVLWAAQSADAACLLGRPFRVSEALAPIRTGRFRRSGELEAEIIAPAALAPRVELAARLCADEAAAAVAALAANPLGAGGAPGFALQMDACLRRSDNARYMGAVKLWVDMECAL